MKELSSKSDLIVFEGKIIIKGVFMGKEKAKQLRVFRDERGFLFELLRKDDELFEGKFGQILVSESNPNVVRAWHLHEKQTDYACCVKGKIKFCTAEEKKAKTEIKEFLLDGEKPVLIKVPAGLWHGYKVLGETPALVVYVMDKAYNPKKPDEKRKPADAFGNIWEK